MHNMTHGHRASQSSSSPARTLSVQIETVSEFMVVHFGYHYNMRWWCVLILFAYIIFVRVTSILALKYCESRCWSG